MLEVVWVPGQSMLRPRRRVRLQTRLGVLAILKRRLQCKRRPVWRSGSVLRGLTLSGNRFGARRRPARVRLRARAQRKRRSMRAKVVPSVGMLQTQCWGLARLVAELIHRRFALLTHMSAKKMLFEDALLAIIHVMPIAQASFAL